jgi:hypothetical protein
MAGSRSLAVLFSLAMLGASAARAGELVVTISPNPVDAQATATITVTHAPTVKTCGTVELEFGDGTKATVSASPYVAKHAWSAAGKFQVKAFAGPVIKSSGTVTCNALAGGSAEVTVRIPSASAAGRPTGGNLAVPAGAPGSAGRKSDAMRQRPTPVPTASGGWGPVGAGGSAVPPNPIKIELVPAKAAPNALVTVKLSGLGTCGYVSVSYGDGKSEGTDLSAKTWGTPVVFYHAYAKAGTFKVSAWASEGPYGVGPCQVPGANASITVE